MEIKDKVALVLGGTRGIGRAISESLSDAGAKIIIPYYDWPEDTAAVKKYWAESNVEHLIVKTDLRSPQEVNQLIQQIDAGFGRLDILINNIERGGMPIVHGAYDSGQWDLEMETTLKAKWWVFQRALPLLNASGDGIVVNLSSIAAKVGRSGPAGLIFSDGYSAANRAVSSFTENWARLAAPAVRVNELMLGFVETRHAEGTRGWALLNEGQKESIINHTLLKRTGKLAEVVRMVMFLIHDATFLTGATIIMDGGYTLGGEAVPPIPDGEADLDVLEVE